MKNPDLVAVILAAGLGKRMKSGLAKVLHRVAGRPMVLYPVEAAQGIPAKRVIVVAGHQADRVREVLEPFQVQVVFQPHQRGTADAVACAAEAFRETEGTVLVLCGDTPLLTSGTLSDLVKQHRSGQCPLTLLSADAADPAGYGRVVRRPDGTVLRIVEEKDATDAIRAIREINTGIYAFDALFLREVLSEIRTENAQQEFYLTDAVEIAVRRGSTVRAVRGKEMEEFMGVNSRADLAVAERALRLRINGLHMRNGVTLLSPENTLIDPTVEIGSDVVIYPNTVIQGKTRIGSGSVLYSNSRIVDSDIGCEVTVKDSCLIESSRIGDGSVIGPFAHLRPESVLGKNVSIGNFVELKKTSLGEGSKANHLTYLGDTEIGRGVNVGAGTITCNYDGRKKHQTIIEDDVFIGSDVQLVAPVRIGKGAFVAAGSTVTEDVPPEALAIARSKQVNKAGWAKRRK
jgi:bifunctional UDP-N-acetylglucosamine pyrophosphorylase/glucosamine-1-phosphate N-acetyltransferase